MRAGAGAWSRLGDGYWIGLFGGRFGFIPEPKPHPNTDLHGYRNRNRNRKPKKPDFRFDSARFGLVFDLRFKSAQADGGPVARGTFTFIPHAWMGCPWWTRTGQFVFSHPFINLHVWCADVVACWLFR
jgi:hypothetical protein